MVNHSDTNLVTKDRLIAAISSTLEVVRPEFDDDTYETLVKFATELETQISNA